ncbi:MAG: TOMM precursor leader peptide-binding protein [Marinibacterium sp.]|nr:TOMM precursor leader peptide-binding protein [Marinibacterium sp.]
MDADARARPKFKASVQPVADGRNGLILLSEAAQDWLPHPVFVDIAPYLDGGHEIATIFAGLTDRYPSATVLQALETLRARGALAEDLADMPPGTRAFWEELGLPPGAAEARLRQARVSVQVLGDIPQGPVLDALARQGILAELGGDGDWGLCVTDDYLHDDLQGINDAALRDGRRWLLVKPTGAVPWIGPAMHPSQSACWACLAHRLRWHRRVALYASQAPGQDLRAVSVRGTRQGALDAPLAEAAAALLRWIGSGGVSPFENRVQSHETAQGTRHDHVLIHRPQCPACGDAGPQDFAGPVTLQPRPKQARADGGHRAEAPGQVLKRLDRHLSPITGIVGGLTPSVRSDAPGFAADHNFADMQDSRFVLGDGMRRRSGGKGKTRMQARISALAESVERYCGVFDGTEPRVQARMADLGDAAIAPNDVLGYSAQQYAMRDDLNRRAHKAYQVATPFDPDARIDWSPLWSLGHGQLRYLPSSMCYFGYRGSGPVFGHANSNGCAAGAVLEEAILQGLLELIERDAVAIWWYNRIARPGLDLTRTCDPYVAEHQARYAGLGREVWALDLTGDLGIPVVAALSRRLDGPHEDILYGFGCHLDPDIALSRALTELDQSLEAVPRAGGPADQQSYLGTPEALAWWQQVRADDTPYLRPAPGTDLRAPEDLPSLATDDLADDIALCVARAARQGIDVLVLDQSRRDVDFSVCRVVAPGLRHFWARFGPGRLYDVPQQLGWQTVPTPEAQLNPHVIQF